MSDWGSVAIVTRIGGMPHPLFFDSWSRLLHGGMRPGDKLMSPALRLPAHRAANAIVRAFLSEGWLQDVDTLCFVDDDHVFTYDTLERLRSDADGQAFDVLGAMYSARGAGRWPIVMRESAKYTDATPKYGVVWDWEPGSVVPVDVVGLGFTMFRRSLLTRMSFPFFAYRDDADGTEYTEDVVGCWQVKALGGRLAVHTGIPIGHIDNIVLKPTTERDTARNPEQTAEMATGNYGDTNADGAVAGGMARVQVRAGNGKQD